MQRRWSTALVVLTVSLSCPLIPAVGAPAAESSAPKTADAAARRTPQAVLRIDARRTGGPVSPLLLGVNHRYSYNGYGIWDPERREPAQRVIDRTRKIGIGMVRYPGGSQANLFDWKQAVGPVEDRACQVNGRWGSRALTAEYGVDEHMIVARRTGVATHITVPFVTETPADAAAWVEYMNARAGQDPDRDGIDWAARRNANQRRLGEPVGPYNVRYWTIGNEPYLKHQRFWMDAAGGKALDQYIGGGRQSYVDQLVGRQCRRSPEVSSGTGEPNQRAEVLYPPVLADSQRITVDGQEWTEVDDLSAPDVTPLSQVYTFDDDTGLIHFGDGLQGQAPEDGAPIRASYTGVHAGFVDFARAMHRVDPGIDVCSEWGRIPFARRMVRSNHAFDCVAAHPYNFIFGQWATPREAHDAHMRGMDSAHSKLYALQGAVRRLTGGRSYVSVTEYGSIALAGQPDYPNWSGSMTDALYMMSSLSLITNSGVPWAEGGALTSEGLRGWFSETPDFVVSAAGRGMEAVRTMMQRGSRLVRHHLDSPLTLALGTRRKYESLGASVVKDPQGGLNILLINRDPNSAVRVAVRNPDFRGAHAAHVWRVTSDRISSANTVQNPKAVQLTQRDQRIRDPRRFSITVAEHSILRLRIRPQSR